MREPIDITRARAQHAAYEDALVACGCRVERVARAEAMPDSVFVEDTAVIVPEVAVITRPGAATRRGETEAVEESIRSRRSIRNIRAPGTLEGGDVLRIGRTVFVGQSTRSNKAGIEQLARILSPFGYKVVSVELRGCLHLKSAVSPVSENTLLIQRMWVDPRPFRPYECMDVDSTELHAANALRIGEHVIYPTAFPRTLERLAVRGLDVRPVDVSELAKAEGAVTCCSLILD
ncbi:dimethylargininase [Candidatus Bipolaricaulota bacterium]|nr:dimethylargininase [Candidatus Bipolaricaulota bacterium]